MKLDAVIAVILISGGMAFAQKAADPGWHYRPASPAVHKSGRSVQAVTGANTTATANELARIEQQGINAHSHAAKSPTAAAAAPAQDKNKPMRFTPKLRQSVNTKNTTSSPSRKVKVH